MQELVFYFGKELMQQSDSLTLAVQNEKQKASSRSVNEESQISLRTFVTPKFLDTLISFKPFGF
jgi:hypothetical protein